MRFLLYNLRYATGSGTSFHLPVPFGGYLRNTTKNFDRIVEFIKSYHPDIVGLVEVDTGSFRAKKSNQVEHLAEALGHYHAYQSKYAVNSLIGQLPVLDKQVNAFVTNDEIQMQKFHYFETGIKRLVIELELKDLNIFLVHLSLRFRHRAYQLRDLYDLVRNVKKPCIVAGDFNALRGGHELRLFMAATGLQSVNPEERPTFPSYHPRKQLDFILHSPEIKVSHFEIPDVKFSDHLPLVCDFEIVSGNGNLNAHTIDDASITA